MKHSLIFCSFLAPSNFSVHLPSASFPPVGGSVLLPPHFDKNIIGINPDFEIKVRQDILEEIDGPMLKYGL
jgi:hypothetical protein